MSVICKLHFERIDRRRKFFLKRLNACIEEKVLFGLKWLLPLCWLHLTHSQWLVRLKYWFNLCSYVNREWRERVRFDICTNEVQRNSVANVADDLSGGFNFCHTHEIWLYFRWKKKRDNHRTYTSIIVQVNMYIREHARLDICVL
jgi:hypothetical protein